MPVILLKTPLNYNAKALLKAFIHKAITHKQVHRYLMASGLSACITLGMPFVLHEVFGVAEQIAVGIALVIAFVANFLMAKTFVFNSNGSHLRELTLFAGASLFFRSFEYLLFLALFDLLHLYYMLALIIVLPTSGIFKFIVYKFVVFKPQAAEIYMDIPDLESKNRTYHVVQDHMQLLPNYYDWTYGRVRKYVRGNVVELGCGAGFGIRSYIDDVKKVYAVDYSPELLERVRRDYPDAKMETVEADLMADWHELSAVKADAVILMDVLEHFKDDRTFLERTKALLNPGAHIIIKVPANSAFYGGIDKASGHYRRYDQTDMEKLGQEVGLKLVELQPINMPGAIIYNLKKKKNSNFSKTFSTGQLKLINVLIPFIRLTDGILRRIPGMPYRGLSLIAVFQKP